jgi:hypothetical protein
MSDSDAEFYAYWAAAREAVKNSTPLPPMQDGKPQGGYYKMRFVKDGPWAPVAIFKDAGDIIVLVGEDESKNPNKTWLSCARHPVDYDVYQTRMETGVWPGERIEPAAKVAGIGDNAPPEETVETILPRELDDIKQWLEQNAIISDEVADIAGNKVGELRKLKSRAEEAHKTEKEPHLKAGKAVDDRYLPNVKRADAAIKYLLDKINVYFDAKRAKEKAAQEAEANRLAAIKAAEEKAVAAARAAAGRPIEGVASPTPTAPPPPSAPPRMAVGGAVGSKISQRTVDVAVITDIDLCFQHFKTNPMVIEVLQNLAQKMIAAKMEVPGVSKEERTVTR